MFVLRICSISLFSPCLCGNFNRNPCLKHSIQENLRLGAKANIISRAINPMLWWHRWICTYGQVWNNDWSSSGYRDSTKYLQSSDPSQVFRFSSEACFPKRVARWQSFYWFLLVEFLLELALLVCAMYMHCSCTSRTIFLFCRCSIQKQSGDKKQLKKEHFTCVYVLKYCCVLTQDRICLCVRSHQQLLLSCIHFTPPCGAWRIVHRSFSTQLVWSTSSSPAYSMDVPISMIHIAIYIVMAVVCVCCAHFTLRHLSHIRFSDCCGFSRAATVTEAVLYVRNSICAYFRFAYAETRRFPCLLRCLLLLMKTKTCRFFCRWFHCTDSRVSLVEIYAYHRYFFSVYMYVLVLMLNRPKVYVSEERERERV